VDPKQIADRLFWGAFENSGQVCSAIKRVYVHEDKYKALLSELAQRAKSVKMGPGLEEGTELGPINNEPQYRRVIGLVEDALKSGAKAVAGGGPAGRDGYFFQPTILGDVHEGMRIVDEEQFGPALPVLTYRDVEDAVERANATMFGLSGSVWSSDPKRGAEVAARLDCGTSWVNQHLDILPTAPFGGAKWSGIGVENGRWGLLGFSETQVIDISKQ
jgi:acyl-CoA reductase-like NAD-dependent aldehyde dehydrogenase